MTSIVADSGWMEALFQKRIRLLRGFQDVDESNYDLVGSPVPIGELRSPFDVYAMLAERRFAGMLRSVRDGDALNLCITRPALVVRSYLIVERVPARTTFFAGVMQAVDDFPHGLLQLPAAFRSKAAK